MTEQLLRLPAVQAATGYGRSSIYGLIKRGQFPRPLKLVGGGAVAWRSSDIQAWIKKQCLPGTTPASRQRLV